MAAATLSPARAKARCFYIWMDGACVLVAFGWLAFADWTTRIAG